MPSSCAPARSSSGCPLADPIKPATTWQETQGQSFEELQAEATAKRVKRENLHPMALGKGRYKDIFKVGDRTRPELALRQVRPDGEPSGSGEVDLETLIPKQALRDLADAYAGANVGAMGEALEGVRETITYDKDESEQLEWTGQPERRVLAPQAQEQASSKSENAAFRPDSFVYRWRTELLDKWPNIPDSVEGLFDGKCICGGRLKPKVDHPRPSACPMYCTNCDKLTYLNMVTNVG